MTEKLILVINPGSITTKVAVFDDMNLVASEVLKHRTGKLVEYKSVADQLAYRNSLVKTFLQRHHLNLKQFDAVVGRGGLLKPLPSGTYLVDDQMLSDLISEKYGAHASNLGGIMAKTLADQVSIPAFVVDPVVVDEFGDLARISGFKGIKRHSIAHVLNQKAVARQELARMGLNYTDANVIVAHLGGGISIGAHCAGKMIDATNGLEGEGPFSPQRTGSLPLARFLDFIFNQNLSCDDVKKMMTTEGGLYSYFGTYEVKKIEHMGAEGMQYLKAMAYQVAKEIGAMATVLKGNVQLIILTGGISNSEIITEEIIKRTDFIAPVTVFPGELEMHALARGATAVLEGMETAKSYKNIQLRGNQQYGKKEMV